MQMIHLGEQVMVRLKTKHDPARAEAGMAAPSQRPLDHAPERDGSPGRADRGPGSEPVRICNASSASRRPASKARPGRRCAPGISTRLRPDRSGGERPAQQRRGARQPGCHAGPSWRDGTRSIRRCRPRSRRVCPRLENQEEIALHPKSGDYKAADNDRILSGIAIKQGTALLALGHAALARERFQKSLDLRHAWIKLEPRNGNAKSYASEAELWLGVASSQLGDWPGARSHFDQSLQICKSLVTQHPQHLPFRGDLATIYGEYGAALMRSGQDGEAENALNQSLAHAREVLAHDAEDTPQRLVTATDSELLAALAVKQGKPAEAERLWRIALEIRADLAQVEPYNLPMQAAFALASRIQAVATRR